jgi:hypothetical protein
MAESHGTHAAPVYRGGSRKFTLFGLRLVTGTRKDTYTFLAALVLILPANIVFFIFVWVQRTL